MLFIILDIWENRNETANFSQKHDVELIKEQKRYPIYIIYFHTFYPRQTWYKFSTRRRTREKKFHTILQYHQKYHCHLDITLESIMSQIGQAHFKNLATNAGRYLKCV